MRHSRLAALLALLSTLAFATTVVPMSVERLTQVSTHVVVAHANKSWSAWDARHAIIYTYTEFGVESWLKGSGASVITVKQPGGSSDGYTQRVAGVRPWSAGESAVLFLHPSSNGDGSFVVSGLMQGDFRLRRSSSGAAIVDNGVSSGTFTIGEEVQSFNPDSGTASPYSGSRMSLDELKARVHAAQQQVTR